REVPVHVHRKALLVLQFLLQRSGEVVTKDELAEACWPGRVLSDSVLATTINRLRTALGDESQGIVRTVHGFGYRLAAPVNVSLSSVTAPTRLELVAGERPPLRPLWRLQRPLGAG